MMAPASLAPRDSGSPAAGLDLNFYGKEGHVARFTPRIVRLAGTTDLYGTLIAPGTVRWECGPVTRVQPGALRYPVALTPSKAPVSRRVEVDARTPLDRERDAAAFRAVVDNHPRHVEARPYDPRLDRKPVKRVPVDEWAEQAAIEFCYAVARGASYSWSEVPELRYLHRVARATDISEPTREAARELLATARELDDRTFLSHDDPRRQRPVADTDRDYFDACYAARNPILEEWRSMEHAEGTKATVIESQGRMPRRAIGTLALELAHRASRMLSQGIVHDRRFVSVQEPMLVPGPDLERTLEDGTVQHVPTYTLLTENFTVDEKTGRVRRHTRSKFYPSVEEAEAAVERITAHLKAKGVGVRVWRPDPLEDSQHISEAARKWRERQRELNRTTRVTVVNGRKVRVRIPTFRRGIASVPVAVVEQHNPNRKEVAA